MSNDEVIKYALSRYGFSSRLSDPGRVAQQMIERLGGLSGVDIISNPDIVRLLNDMSVSIRRKNNTSEIVEENFDRRSSSTKKWCDVISKVRKKLNRSISLKDFTDRDVIRIGIETKCTKCGGFNWHGLDNLAYKLKCERCLNQYDFPQSTVFSQEHAWKFREMAYPVAYGKSACCVRGGSTGRD